MATVEAVIGGVRANEDWTIRVDAGNTIRSLANRTQSISRLGLSFQRSQNSGRVSPQPGPSLGYYKRLQSMVEAPAKEQTFFDGIDTTIALYWRCPERLPPSDIESSLAAIEQHIKAAVSSFTFADPSASAPALAVRIVRPYEALADKGSRSDLAFALLQMKADRGRHPRGAWPQPVGHAQPAGTPEATGPFAAGSRTCRQSCRARPSRCGRRSRTAASARERRAHGIGRRAELEVRPNTPTAAG